MRNTNTVRYQIAATIWLLSIVFWIILLFDPGNIMQIKHCHVSMSGPSAASLSMLLAMNPFSDLMTGWVLMVFAMMLPKLITPIHFIYQRSLKRKRFFAAMLFVLGYGVIWTIAGILLNVVILACNLLMPQSYVPAVVVAIITIIWQFSPIKQRFLNRGHDHWSLAAFGWPAIKDAFMFGVMHGIWCVGSGWALMLLPMLLPQAHNITMLFVTFIMISEHMEHPRLPRWYFSFRLKLLRIMVTQTKLKLSRIVANQ